MAFESFDDLARVGLKRASMKAARVVVKSGFELEQVVVLIGIRSPSSASVSDRKHE